MAACVTCGQEFEPRQKTQLYCSAKCRNASPRRQYKRGIYPMTEAVCERCGKKFTTRNRAGAVEGVRGGTARFCSRHCAYVRPIEETNRILIHRMLERITQCRRCGGLFLNGRNGERFCSSECRRIHANAKAWGKNNWETSRLCKLCNAEFDAGPDAARGDYCSDECREKVEKQRAKKYGRIAKSRRRARIRNVKHESIDPFDVFARDNWTCQICGDKTPRRLRGTYDDKAPELDHIIPLAAGGTHTWDNVQCACRACNGTKGAGAAVDQLRLELTA